MANSEEVQTLPLRSAPDFSDNHVSEDKQQQQQQQQQQSGPACRMKRAASAGGIRLLAVCCLLLLLALLVIAVLLAVLATRRCSDVAGDSADTAGDGSDRRQSQQRQQQQQPGTYRDDAGQLCAHQGIRLPRDLVPRHYLLVARPVLQTTTNLGDRSVNYGQVDMELACTRPTAAIIFHVGAQQNITRLQVASLNSSAELPVLSTQHCVELSQLLVRISRPCQAGELLNLSLSFSRLIDSNMDGFYLGHYKDKTKAKRFLASTHMEPISARKAFPCFDEPDMKATFVLHMIRDSRHRSLFNMPLAETRPDTGCTHVTDNSGCFRDVYHRSEIMSTYLVAFAILPLDYVSIQKTVKTNRNSLKVGIWAPSHSQDQLEFAMNVTEKVLPYFEELFNLSYPLPKLDMIGVPDFSAGAMENWGLIIYRFLTLLYDKANTPTLDKQMVAEVISHEIAHQWFGNIVTMKWWDDLWLNEAFAVFTQFMGVDAFDPSWKMMDRCYVEFVVNAMQTDSMFHSHPIIMAGVTDPNEIESLFDDISYFKGSSLIRMLEGVIGRLVLKEGLIMYLNRFVWRNAASSDLFTAFSEAYIAINGNAGPHANSPVQNLTRVMDTWTTQVNYPLVTVQVRGSRLHFRQERFLLVPNATSLWESPRTNPTRYGYKWIIPIMYMTDKLTEPKWTWMDLEETTTVELDHEPKFVKINFNQTGLYRCNYELSNWRELIQLSREGYFASTDIAGLLNDAFTLAYVGRLDISVPFDLFETLEDDRLSSATPWSIAMRKISEISSLIASDQDLGSNLSRFIRKVLRMPLKNILGKPESSLSHTDLIKRQTLNQIAIMVDEPSVVELYWKKYRDWRADQSIALLPDEIDLVYQTGVSKGNTSDWNFFWNKYTEGASVYDMKHVLSALAASSDFNMMLHMVQLLFNDNHTRTVDAITIAAKIGRRVGALDLVWTHFLRNWDKVVRLYGHIPFLMSEITKFPAEFYTEYDYKRTQEFFESNTLTSGKRNAYQSLEMIRANIAWIKHNLASFRSFIVKKAAKIKET